ncbi:MAG: ribonuclease HII [Gammaproteobacteria bacterium]
MIAGIDEAGRGPLAGPVVAAAVCFKTDIIPKGLKDSKLLSPKKREALFSEIQNTAYWAIGVASVAEIDQYNILQATLMAMQRAYQHLPVHPVLVQIDGNQAPSLPCPIECIIKGDQLIPMISAASILAKVTRDRMMLEADQQYPQYGFADHKGYGTKSHMAALRTWGPCDIHRQSFSPVREMKAYHAVE